MKVLHLSFHKGCINDIKYVLNNLNIQNEYMFIDDFGEQKYNMTRKRANILWEKYKNEFEKYDCIITSDTVPLCRIFLENNWSKKLIIWICNRFDYTHLPVRDGPFPDPEYYDIIRKAVMMDNVYVIGYTKFENFYCKNKRNIDIGNKVIKPSGGIDEIYKNNNIIKEELKETLFIPPYHNDTIYMNLSEHLNTLGLKNVCCRYNGPMDLLNYKAVVHIPYAWNNLALFESLSLGIIYFIPSKEFLYKLMIERDNFFWQDKEYLKDHIELSEWYTEEHKDVFVYFNSWEHLKELVCNIDYENQKNKIKEFFEEHKANTFNSWKEILFNS